MFDWRVKLNVYVLFLLLLLPFLLLLFFFLVQARSPTSARGRAASGDLLGAMN